MEIRINGGKMISVSYADIRHSVQKALKIKKPVQLQVFAQGIQIFEGEIKNMKNLENILDGVAYTRSILDPH